MVRNVHCVTIFTTRVRSTREGIVFKFGPPGAGVHHGLWFQVPFLFSDPRPFPRGRGYPCSGPGCGGGRGREVGRGYPN